MAGTSQGAIILLVRGDLLSQGCGTITAQQSWSQLAGMAGKILDPDAGHTLVRGSHTVSLVTHVGQATALLSLGYFGFSRL